jgi:hypothetical protein
MFKECPVTESVLSWLPVFIYSCLHVGFLWPQLPWHFLNILISCTCLCYKSNTNQIMWLCRWDWGSCLYYHWCIHHCDACLLNIMRKWNRGQPAGLPNKNVYSRHVTHDQNVAIILVLTVLDSVHVHWSNKCCLLTTFYMYQGHTIFGINLHSFQIIHFICCTLVTPWTHLAGCCELIMKRHGCNNTTRPH